MAGILKDFRVGGNVYKIGTKGTLTGSVVYNLICVISPPLFLHRKHLNPCLQHTLLLITSWLFALSMKI